MRTAIPLEVVCWKSKKTIHRPTLTTNRAIIDIGKNARESYFMADTGQYSWMRTATGDENRLEAFVRGVGFSPHRHDTYAIGLTLSGIQSFTYRGAVRHSSLGHAFVLYPDELHDGHAGTDEGFSYRTAYIEPADLQSIFGGAPLPFIEGGVSSNHALVSAVKMFLADYECPMADLERDDALFGLAEGLMTASGGRVRARSRNYQGATAARCYILDNLMNGVSMADLEQSTGYDRWQLSRDFRYFFGVSPHQYLIRRRLEKSKTMLTSGMAIAEIATTLHFSDQSHFTRHFGKTFGLTPKSWRQAFQTKTSPAHKRSINS